MFLKRKCLLVNKQTEQIISADSISDFCKKAKLLKNDKFHITPILNGDRPSHKHWVLPSVFYKKICLKDIYGNIYKDSIRNFIFKNGLTFQFIWKLINNKKMVSNGLMLKNTNINHININSYIINNYKFLSPKNKIVKLKTIRKSLKDISYHSLWSLSRGKYEKIKGYKFLSADIQKKSIL
jgi:hypothetical protein